jgi:hypothetical protein
MYLLLSSNGDEWQARAESPIGGELYLSVTTMMKLLMTWDIRPGKESEYFEFVVQEFAPKMLRMGMQPTEAWYTVYGEGPQILAGVVTEDRASLDKALAGEDWQRLKKKLLTYVLNFNYKIVQHTGNFQL